MFKSNLYVGIFSSLFIRTNRKLIILTYFLNKEDNNVEKQMLKNVFYLEELNYQFHIQTNEIISNNRNQYHTGRKQNNSNNKIDVSNCKKSHSPVFG